MVGKAGEIRRGRMAAVRGTPGWGGPIFGMRPWRSVPCGHLPWVGGWLPCGRALSDGGGAAAGGGAALGDGDAGGDASGGEGEVGGAGGEVQVGPHGELHLVPTRTGLCEGVGHDEPGGVGSEAVGGGVAVVEREAQVGDGVGRAVVFGEDGAFCGVVVLGDGIVHVVVRELEETHLDGAQHGGGGGEGEGAGEGAPEGVGGEAHDEGQGLRGGGGGGEVEAARGEE